MLATVPDEEADGQTLNFVVTEIPHLNLLGYDAIQKLQISGDDKTKLRLSTKVDTVNMIFKDLQPDRSLRQVGEQLCQEFSNLFQPELGCLKDFELEVRFKPDTKPVFCKAQPVPFAMQSDLIQAYEAGIKRGIWKPVQFNNYRTPVVLIRKVLLPGQQKRKL
ncbi:uncharacterized protein [Watersipora subatra]|uniref:uncharacterized protein n=1 Tax=Watersipora subatra TaxID=2589382 RepID=UPI00355B9C8B